MLPATPGCWFLRPVLACWRDMTCAKHSKVQHPFGRARWSSLMLILAIMQKSSKNCIRCYVFSLIEQLGQKGEDISSLGCKFCLWTARAPVRGGSKLATCPTLAGGLRHLQWQGKQNDLLFGPDLYLQMSFASSSPSPTLVDTLPIFAIHFHAFSAVRGTVHQAAQTLRATAWPLPYTPRAVLGTTLQDCSYTNLEPKSTTK